MKISEFIFLAGLGVFAGVLLYDGWDMPYVSGLSFGPGFVPVNIAVITLVFATILVLRGVLALRKAKLEIDETTPPGWMTVLPAVGTMALLLVATFAMHIPLPYLPEGSVLIPLAVVITVVSAVFLKHSWPRAIVLTMAVLAFIYVIFSLWLKIPLN